MNIYWDFVIGILISSGNFSGLVAIVYTALSGRSSLLSGQDVSDILRVHLIIWDA